MASYLYVEEYQNKAQLIGDDVQVPGALIANQRVSIGAGIIVSSALNVDTRYVILSAEIACHFEEDATVTADSRVVLAGVRAGFGVAGGKALQVLTRQA